MNFLPPASLIHKLDQQSEEEEEEKKKRKKKKRKRKKAKRKKEKKKAMQAFLQSAGLGPGKAGTPTQ